MRGRGGETAGVRVDPHAAHGRAVHRHPRAGRAAAGSCRKLCQLAADPLRLGNDVCVADAFC
eukprot:1604397-Pyramimonas_sp.AAC.1